MVAKDDITGLRVSIAAIQKKIAGLRKQALNNPKIENKLKVTEKRLEKKMKKLKKLNTRTVCKPSPRLEEKPLDIPVSDRLKRDMAFSKRTGDSRSYDRKVDALMKELEKI